MLQGDNWRPSNQGAAVSKPPTNPKGDLEIVAPCFSPPAYPGVIATYARG